MGWGVTRDADLRYAIDVVKFELRMRVRYRSPRGTAKRRDDLARIRSFIRALRMLNETNRDEDEAIDEAHPCSGGEP